MVFDSCELSALHEFQTCLCVDSAGKITIKGFLPMNKEMQQEPAIRETGLPTAIDGLKEHYLLKFIQLCKQKGVNLVFYAPLLHIERPWIINLTTSRNCRIRKVSASSIIIAILHSFWSGAISMTPFI